MGLNPDTLVSNGGMYDVNTIMGGGSSGGGDSGGYMQSSIQTYVDAISKLKEYDKANPFAFDEALAKEAATKEYSPYYNELLTDYTADVEKTKSRSSFDLGETLKQLQAGLEYYSGAKRREIDQAKKSSNEGYAGRGLYMAGARGTEEKRLENQYTTTYGPEGYQTGQYLASQEKAKLGSSRDIADATTLASRYARDTNRDMKTAIEGGVLTRKGEYISKYETGRKNYYDNQIPGNYYTGIYG